MVNLQTGKLYETANGDFVKIVEYHKSNGEYPFMGGNDMWYSIIGKHTNPANTLVKEV